jgi:hypothetical protein
MKEKVGGGREETGIATIGSKNPQVLGNNKINKKLN